VAQAKEYTDSVRLLDKVGNTWVYSQGCGTSAINHNTYGSSRRKTDEK